LKEDVTYHQIINASFHHHESVNRFLQACQSLN